jgi:hypothetical protein
MSGKLIAFGECFGHGGLFMFDPEQVPTIWISRRTRGTPEPGDTDLIQVPVCPACARRVNPQRARAGLELMNEADTAAWVG